MTLNRKRSADLFGRSAAFSEDLKLWGGGSFMALPLVEVKNRKPRTEHRSADLFGRSAAFSEDLKLWGEGCFMALPLVAD